MGPSNLVANKMCVCVCARARAHEQGHEVFAKASEGNSPRPWLPHPFVAIAFAPFYPLVIVDVMAFEFEWRWQLRVDVVWGGGLS
jgi:hypothetical protein